MFFTKRRRFDLRAFEQLPTSADKEPPRPAGAAPRCSRCPPKKRAESASR